MVMNRRNEKSSLGSEVGARRFSPRLVGKRVDYRPMLGMSVPRNEKEKVTLHYSLRIVDTFTASCGKARAHHSGRGTAGKHLHGNKSIEVFPENRPITRSCGRKKFDLLGGTSLIGQKKAGKKTKTAAKENENIGDVLVRATYSETLEVRLLARKELFASRNKVVQGKFVTCVRHAYAKLKQYEKPYTADMIADVVHQSFLDATPQQLDAALRQLYHHVLCRDGVLSFAKNHGLSREGRNFITKHDILGPAS